ncbi:MAG TPA: VanW family protein [Clostridia bacterium]
MKLEKIKNIKFIIISTAIFMLLFVIIKCALLLCSNTFYSGVFVEDMDLSGMKMLEAKNYVNNIYSKKYNKPVLKLKYNDGTSLLRFEDISLRFNTDKAVEEAYNAGRKGNIFIRLGSIASMFFKPYIIKCGFSYDKESLLTYIYGLKSGIDRPAKNASVNFKKGSVILQAETKGQELLCNENIKLIEDRVDKRDFRQIELLVRDKVPEILFSDIKNITGVMSSFSTVFTLTDENRCHNIKVGSDRINGMILLPGDIFSINSALGPRTSENGYREAPVILKNELTSGVGGGLCQLTSTLYDAALLSKMEIVERTHHSWPLGYVAPGMDATIAEGYIDFKFRNSTEHVVAVNSEISNSKLTVRILGLKNDDSTGVRLRPSIIEELQPQKEEIIEDSTLPQGERVVEREAKKGVRAVVYRETLSGSGEVLSSEKISEDFYPPVSARVRVGSTSSETAESDPAIN